MAKYFGGDSPEDDVIGKCSTNHRAGRHDGVAAKCGARKDYDIRPEPTPRADVDCEFDGCLPTHRVIGILIRVVLVRDVDVGTRLNLVAEDNRPMANDVRASTNDALAPNADNGRGQHFLVAADTRREADVGSNERLVPNREVALVVDHALGSHQRGAIAEIVKFVGVGVGGPDGRDFVRVATRSANPLTQKTPESKAGTHPSHATWQRQMTPYLLCNVGS